MPDFDFLHFGDCDLDDCFCASDALPSPRTLSRYLITLADVLRDAGLVVHEVDGWRTRSRASGGYQSGRPTCVMWHHTASKTTAANDVAYIATGSPVAPICNLYLGRDGAVTVIAAGATNTNGVGGPTTLPSGSVVAKDQMNTHAISIEIANDGIGEAWSQRVIDAAFTISIALCRAYAIPITDICTHAEYTSRKIDPARAGAVQGPWQPRPINTAGTWSVADLRAEQARRATPITPPEGDEMQIRLLILTDSDAQFIAETTSDGVALYVTWAGPGSPAVDQAIAAHRAAAKSKGQTFEQSGNISGLFNCVLVGALPFGDSKHTWSGAEFWKTAS